VKIEAGINSTNRSAGAMLSGAIAKIYGNAGCRMTPSRSASRAPPARLSAHAPHGVTFELEGEAND